MDQNRWQESTTIHKAIYVPADNIVVGLRGGSKYRRVSTTKPFQLPSTLIIGASLILKERDSSVTRPGHFRLQPWELKASPTFSS